MPIGRVSEAWLNFAGGVLVVAVLYWAQPVVVPLVLAVLITFVLTPVVAPLQRALGRVAAVLLVVVATFSALGVAGWAVTRQMSSIVQELPQYRTNIRQKVRDIRAAGSGGSVATLQDTVADIQQEIDKSQPGTTAAPVVVQSSQVAGLWGFPTAVGPWLEPLANAGLVVVLVIFMLLERQELRNRLIKLFGYGRLAVTTKAFDEAGTRVSRYLLRQSLLNLIYGGAVGISLYAIGVPYVALWASLAAALRFIPYVGPWIAALAPMAVGLAVFDGWSRPLAVGAVFIVLELIANVVLEPLFYAGAAGISELGLLVAVAFWTWLWGPIGLLIATPLTVCLVVMGKYVPGLEFLSTLIGAEPALENDVTYYQRLLAGDQSEAAEILSRYVDQHDADTVYDALVLRALTYAERDRLEGRLSSEDETALINRTSDLMSDLDADRSQAESESAGATPITILGCPAEGAADAMALQMLARILPPSIKMNIASPALLSFDLIELVKTNGYGVVCIADLPPSAPSKSRYLAKRLRAALPELKIVIGRWGPELFDDDAADVLRAAGADAVATQLVSTREAVLSLHATLRSAA